MDFQKVYGLRLRECVASWSWNELWVHARPLLASPFSHVFAGIMGWSRPPEPAEEAARYVAQILVDINSGKNTLPWEPDRPWRTPPPEEKKIADVHASQARRAKLAERLNIQP